MTIRDDDDRFLKLRCLAALAHADGKVTKEETDLLKKQFKNEDLTPFQLEILENDLENEQDPSILFAKISSENERSDLIHRAHLLFWSDGEFHQSEKRIFDILKDKARSGYKAPVTTDETDRKQKRPWFGEFALKAALWWKALSGKK